MRKIFLLFLAAAAIFAIASCEGVSNGDNDDPTYEYYKPLIGKWSVYRWYGTSVNEYGVEAPFDYPELIENGYVSGEIIFSESKLMTMNIVIDGESMTTTANVSFKIDVPNYFTASSGGSSEFCQIVSVSSSQLHLRIDSGSSLTDFVCTRK